MHRLPEVTVVVPTRDRWRFLSLALAGALAQQGVALEVVVVDDGSTGVTPRRLLDVTDDRVRVIRHDVSLGQARARNAGIAVARGEWLAFLDDDDLWSPRKLRTLIDLADADDAAFAYSSVVLVGENHVPTGIAAAPRPDGLLAELLRYNAIPGAASNVIARTEAVRNVGGFDEALSHVADWDLWIRLACGEKAAACAEPLVGYVKHPGSILAASWQEVPDEIEYLTAKHRDLYVGEATAVDHAAVASWIASGHRLAGRPLLATRGYLLASAMHVRRGDTSGARSDLEHAVSTLVGGTRLSRLAQRFRTEPVPAPAWLASSTSNSGVSEHCR